MTQYVVTEELEMSAGTGRPYAVGDVISDREVIAAGDLTVAPRHTPDADEVETAPPE